MSPGMVYRLPPGKTVTTSQPPSFDDTSYSRERKQEIATALGSTYEEMTGDYSMVNFTSARIARDANHKFHTQIREQMIVPKILNKIWTWFVEAVDLSDRIDLGSLNSYSEIKRVWSFPALPFIQPEEELKAAELELDLGISTPSEIVRRRGKDPQKHFEQLVEDLNWLKELNLERYFKVISELEQKAQVETAPTKEEEKPL